ncbi:membrane-associated progesterone receptor component 1 [Niveomyces insectorum RCEF 264]|uniref:Membrane-associated progesterone receptor component 1 n=1 Tax=Niveomyces insectorum RCEF 264 TaxID=1081102 RepID=A0A162J9U8_9HYPO|nr:membrane-associated progesterone receptor component 1 [Niveomyces insectorum RCEF 264]
MDYVEQRMAQEAQKHEAADAVTGFLTPLNVFLAAIALYTVYRLLLRSSAPAVLPKDPPATVFRTFTPRTLLPYNGQDGKPVYLAVRGRVFDVTAGRNFYGPGGPYENFAGRDASRGLASHSFDEDMLTKDLDGPLDPLADLDGEQREALQGWEERFDSKYLVVGRLVAAADYEKATAKGNGARSGSADEK